MQPTLVRPFDSSPASDHLSSPSSVRHVDMLTRQQGNNRMKYYSPFGIFIFIMIMKFLHIPLIPYIHVQ